MPPAESRARVLEQLRRRHLAMATVGTVLVVGVALVTPGTAGLGVPQVALLVAAVALLGVPHGALDHLAGRRLLAQRLGPAWLPAFLTGYLALSVGVIALWVAYPLVGLGLFLAVAVLHFGAEDVGPAGRSPGGLRRAVEVATRGGLPIVVPAAFFTEEVGAIFDQLGLAGAPVNGAVLATGLATLWPALVVGLVVVVAGRLLGARRPGQSVPVGGLVELPVLLALWATLPPLLSFVIYFVGWHSVRHTLEWVVRLDPQRPGRGLARFARLAVPLTAATLVLGGVAFFGLRGSFTQEGLQVVFVGLAALTIPHVLLEGIVDRTEALP